MILDTEKMLKNCQKGQWSVDDFDWTQTPTVKLSKEDEMRFCQYYMDMSFIERIAGDLFLSLSKRLEDPTLIAIYETFVVDELRHSHAAAKLMDYFDVHHYKVYTPNKSMLNFIPAFSDLVKTVNPAFANSMMTAGELVLDIALLRGINEAIDDPLSKAVVEKINQDESRHLAMDFYMTEYCSENNMKTVEKAKLNFQHPMLRLLRASPGFANEVFLRPMQRVDPNNKQMEAVAKRLRRIYLKPEVQNNPAAKQMNAIFDWMEGPVGSKVGPVLEKTLSRTTRLDFSWVYAGSLKNLKMEKDEWAGSTTAVEMADKVVNH